MVRKRKSPLDLTERQMKNLLMLVGIGISIYWATIKFTPDATFLAFIASVFFGLKLIPIKWWGDKSNGNDSQESSRRTGLAKDTESDNQDTRRNHNDMVSIGYASSWGPLGILKSLARPTESFNSG